MRFAHISDTHIRNLKYHKEYREVFKKLYTAAKELPKNSIIYVAGDIVHNKTDISPELIDLTSEFFIISWYSASFAALSSKD